eukprot:3800179-Amphidinium_carterae.1
MEYLRCAIHGLTDTQGDMALFNALWMDQAATAIVAPAVAGCTYEGDNRGLDDKLYFTVEFVSIVGCCLRLNR